MQPSAMRSTSATVACLTPVLASTGVSGSTFFTASRSDIAAASPVIAPDTRIASGNAREDRAAGPVGEAAPVERIGEFGGDVVEQREVAAAEPVAIAHRGLPASGVHGPMSEA